MAYRDRRPSAEELLLDVVECLARHIQGNATTRALLSGGT
jgi:hypothetical protein